MNRNRNRKNHLIKTLSTEDIHNVLDQYGSEGNSNLKLTNNNAMFQATPASQPNPTSSNFYIEDNCSLQEEWDFLFHGDDFRERLKQQAFDGNIGSQNFRSVCWRVFWECLSENKSNWLNEVREKREIYTNIRSKYVIDPYEGESEMDINKHHPLSLAEDSVWNKYFQDNELRSTIMQDLDRLYPEIDFFQQEDVKLMILHVLFCYARENPNVSYKQGMHEILALLIYVIIQNCDAVVKSSEEDISNEIKVILDKMFIEHDAYILFHSIMDSMEPWFTNLQQNNGAQNVQKMPNEMFQNPTDNLLVSAISKKLNRIQWYMLKRYDSALCDHLRKIDITPQLYGIRWIRLLFGREFSISRLLTLWDAIFGDGPVLDLLDYVYIAMLINLRAVLLQSDFNCALTYLMKYPANTDTKYILKRAVTLKMYKPKVGQQQTPSKTLQQPYQPQQRPVRPIHPVRNRLGETKEQRYAQALGSGSAVAQQQPKRTGSFSNIIKPSLNQQKKVYDDDNNGNEQQQGKTEFNVEPYTSTNDRSYVDGRGRASMSSQISNLKSKVTTSPQQIISRLPNPLRNKNNQRSIDTDTLVEDHARLQTQVSQLQSQLDKMQSLCLYCGNKMEFYIATLQDRLLKEEKFSDEVGILSIAGLKQVRDIVKNSSEFRGSTLDYDVDFNDIDEHISTASNGHYSKQQANKPGDLESPVLPDKIPVPYLADFNHFQTSSITTPLTVISNSENVTSDSDATVTITNTTAMVSTETDENVDIATKSDLHIKPELPVKPDLHLNITGQTVDSNFISQIKTESHASVDKLVSNIAVTVPNETRHRVSPLVSSDVDHAPTFIAQSDDPLNANELNQLSTSNEFVDDQNPLSKFKLGS